MRNTTLILLMMFTALNLAEAANAAYEPVPSQVSFDSVTKLPVSHPNAKSAYGDDPLQFGWLWQPTKPNTKPLIVLVHGGCWLKAFGVDHSFPMATALAEAGYPVWSLEYRRTGDPGGGWPGSFNDIKQALLAVEQLQNQGINTDEIILMGHSAGGHLALLAANELPQIKFKHIIGLAAITDISRYALGSNSCQSAAPKFMGGMPHDKSAAYQQANLIYRQLPQQVILLQGDADRIVPVIQSQLHEVQVELVEGAGHFDWIHPGTPAFQKLMQVLNPPKKAHE